MRRSVIALLLPATVMAGCGARSPAVPAPVPHPMRVMSINLCTDQLVLALLPPGRVASVSWLARDPSGSVMAAAAARVGVNRGEAEEVIAQAPDLIVGDTFSKPVLRAMLKRLGYPLVEVAEAGNIDSIRRATRRVAAALDERARGEALIAAMDVGFADLARDPGPPTRVAAWTRDGIGGRPGMLQDAVLSAAGAHNIARDLDRGGRGRGADIETLLASHPALLIESADGARAAPSLGDAMLRHPLLRRYWRGRVLRVRGAYTACGTPMIAAAALRLRERLRAEAGRGGGSVAPMSDERR